MQETTRPGGSATHQSDFTLEISLARALQKMHCLKDKQSHVMIDQQGNMTDVQLFDGVQMEEPSTPVYSFDKFADPKFEDDNVEETNFEETNFNSRTFFIHSHLTLLAIYF